MTGPAARTSRICCGPPSARWTSRPLGAYLGYYPRQTLPGRARRLYARALAVEGRRATASVVALDSSVSAGGAGLGGDYIATVRAEVGGTRDPEAHVLLAASHAHSTPQSTDIADLAEVPRRRRLAGGAGGADRGGRGRAWAGPPGLLRGTAGLCPGVAWNRRILTRDGRLVRLAARPRTTRC